MAWTIARLREFKRFVTASQSRYIFAFFGPVVEDYFKPNGAFANCLIYLTVDLE
jgi:hypothetical protein